MVLDNDTVMSEYLSGNEEPLLAVASALDPVKHDEHVKKRLRVECDGGGEDLYVFEMQSGGVYAMEAGYITNQAEELRLRGHKCELVEGAEL